jgi:hypothetical protein
MTTRRAAKPFRGGDVQSLNVVSPDDRRAATLQLAAVDSSESAAAFFSPGSDDGALPGLSAATRIQQERDKRL